MIIRIIKKKIYNYNYLNLIYTENVTLKVLKICLGAAKAQRYETS
jgi:hypothetical protein